MRIGKLAGLAVASLALCLAVDAPASAVDYSMSTDDGDPGGKVKFTMHGDVVEVCDQESDGYAAKVWVYNPNGSTRYTLQAGTSGVCKTARASQGGSHDLTEGVSYTFKICLHKSGSDKYCDTSDWKNGE